jgi:hypothetical protein
MATMNDWIVSNITDRLTDPALDLKVTIEPYEFTELSFHDAADYTAKLIYQNHKNIYLSLSGGADSDFVLHCLMRNDIPFVPIIVKTSGNEEEMQYAFKSCTKFGLEPIIIDLSDSEILNRYYEDVIKRICGYGIYSIPSIISCEYARDRGGILIIGEHMIDADKLNNNAAPGLNEWDFYNECFVGKEYSIPFFLYTIELCYAMVKLIDNRLPLDVLKHKMYGIERRPIMSYNFSSRFMDAFLIINSRRKHKPNSHFDFGSKEQTLNVLQIKKNPCEA